MIIMISSPPQLPVVIAITGASGACYGVRLLEVLLGQGVEVHLTLSGAAVEVLRHELQAEVNLHAFEPAQLYGGSSSGEHPARSGILRELVPMTAKGTSSRIWQVPAATGAETSTTGRLVYHSAHNYMAGIASGSFQTAGMVICPCSMGTLSAIASGLSTNLIQRAADVHLKERRTLIVVPRETPLGSIQLENMKRLVDAGAVVLPAMPGFYHHPQSVADLVDFVVARICDHLKLGINLVPRWGEDRS